MGIKRHRPEEIVTKLRQVEVLVGQGLARIDAIREVGKFRLQSRLSTVGVSSTVEWGLLNSKNSSVFKRRMSG